MKSAVEWLVANLDIDLVDSDWYIEKAKEMEKLEKNNYICIKCKCKIDEEMHKVSD